MGNNMKAVVFHGIEHGFRIEDKPTPHLENADDVLLEVKLAGLCGTDVAILEGRHPATEGVIMGHEYTGRVMKIGRAVRHVKVGDKVVVDPNIKCGHCYYCRTGHQNFCENITTLGIFRDGGIARYNVAPASAVYKLPDDMRWNDTVLIEPVSCVVNGISQACVKHGDTIVIIGAGPMGLIWTQLVKARGVGCIIVSDPIDKRLSFAKKMGATLIVNSKKENLVERVKEVTDGRLANIAVEVVGNSVTVAQALDCIGYGGTALLFGTVNPEKEVPIKPYEVMRYEKKIIGSFTANYTVTPAISVMHNRLIDSDLMLTHEFKVEEFDKALVAYHSGDAIKIVLRP